MTLNEFLDDYVPRVLRPMGNWGLKSESIRRKGCCPLTAERDLDLIACCDEAKRLGLSDIDHYAITSAADFIGQNPTIRARLLAGLGLSEPR